MGSGKSLMAVILNLIGLVLSHSQQHDSLCKHLILCYSVEASRGIKDLLNFNGTQCEKARHNSHHDPSACSDCRTVKNRAIQMSPLCCAVGLAVEQVKMLNDHVLILGNSDGAVKGTGEQVTSPYNDSAEAQRFRDSWIVITTPQAMCSDKVPYGHLHRPFFHCHHPHPNACALTPSHLIPGSCELATKHIFAHHCR